MACMGDDLPLLAMTDQLDGRAEILELGPGIRLQLLDVTAARQLDIEGTRPEDRHCLNLIGLTHGGLRLSLDTAAAGEDWVNVNAGRTHRFLPGEGGVHIQVPAGENLRGIGLQVSPTALEGLFGGAGVPRVLQCYLEAGPKPCFFESRLPSAGTLRVVDNMLAQDMADPALRRLLLLAKTLEYLALTVSDLEAPDDDPSGLSAQEVEILRTAREKLLADLTKPPSLRQLATSVGLHEKKLNEGFKTLFGVTVFECLRNERLEQARTLLFDLDMPLKTIAWKVGYSHVNNFITAYRNRFGEPPRRHLSGTREG